jgi:hypothetical protein
MEERTCVSERSTAAGDLWVAGGPCGSYEDVSGAWIPVAPCASVVTHQGLRSGDLIGPPSRTVNVYTVQGKLLGAWDRGALSGSLAAGTYFLVPVSGANSGIVRFSVVEHRAR